MKCPICDEDVQSIKTIYKGGSKIEGCCRCVTLTPRVNYKNYDDTMGFRIGTAHLSDIRSRKIAPDGSVYRDKGTKYFS